MFDSPASKPYGSWLDNRHPVCEHFVLSNLNLLRQQNTPKMMLTVYFFNVVNPDEVQSVQGIPSGNALL
jgi:hypothetical protein